MSPMAMPGKSWYVLGFRSGTMNVLTPWYLPLTMSWANTAA